MEAFQGFSLHTSHWSSDNTKENLSGLVDKAVGIVGTDATAVHAVPGLGKRPGNSPCSSISRLRLISAPVIRPIPTGRGNRKLAGRPSDGTGYGKSWTPCRPRSKRLSAPHSRTMSSSAAKRRPRSTTGCVSTSASTRWGKTKRPPRRSSRGRGRCVSARALTTSTCRPVIGPTLISSIPPAKGPVFEDSTSVTYASIPLALKARGLACTTRSRVSKNVT